MELHELKGLIKPAFSETILSSISENERHDYLKYKIFPIQLLVKADWNYKEENNFMSDKLKENLKRNGQIENIQVRLLQTGFYEVINGNHRLDEMVDLGRKTVIAYDHGVITKQEAIRKTIESNETKFIANPRILAELMNEIATEFGDADIAFTMPYTEDEIRNLKSMLDLDNGGGGGNGKQVSTSSLKEKFGISPFSVLDAASGAWQERKNKWLDLGIKSEEGRGAGADGTQHGLTFANSAQPPHVYEAKNEYEAKMGRKISWDEFYQANPEAFTHTGTSIFDPVTCELMYKWFCVPNGTILDPFAGGSVRGLVAAVTGNKYHGVDLRSEQIAANEQNALEILRDEEMPRWYCGDSTNIDEIVKTPEGGFDLVFSCPPYGDLEVYSDNPSDLSTMTYEQFVSAYKVIIKKSVAMLKNNSFAVFVVGEIREKKVGFYRNFVLDTILAFEEAGASFYNDIIYRSPAGSLAIWAGRQFNTSRKIGKTHQNILVFFKGDPKTIKEKYGDVVMEETDEEPIVRGTGKTDELPAVVGKRLIKISVKSMMQLFHPCTFEFIRDTCQASCCESHGGKRATVISVHPSEVEKIESKGAKVENGLLVDDGKKCVFKNEQHLCSIHGTDYKPFGCIASPFTLNKKDTMIVRNRYRMLKCFKTEEGKIPAYKAHNGSLVRIFGEEETQRIVEKVEAGSDDFMAYISEFNYSMLKDNDEIKQENV